jgi:hypothetical protein
LRRIPGVSPYDIVQFLCPIARTDQRQPTVSEESKGLSATAMTLEDPKDRRVYLKLANLWREMAYAAEQEAGALSQETAVVIAFPSNSLRLSR